jgi:hypothetical protein
MAPKHIIAAQQRAARQQQIDASPVITDFRGVGEIGVELRFHDPEGKQTPSPRAVIYAGGMHAFFEFRCPLRECTGGGYDATAELQAALGKRRDGQAGKLTCSGTRARGGVKNQRCNLEMSYVLSIRGRAVATA